MLEKIDDHARRSESEKLAVSSQSGELVYLREVVGQTDCN